MSERQAVLALADGSVFRGRAVGADGYSVGEVVFNTAMTGYQEILTDPSYASQLVTLTFPHIGNVGCNPVDAESDRAMAAGLILRDVPRMLSNYRSEISLNDYLRDQGVVAIADVDTRRLTRHLRDQGAQNGCLLVGEDAEAALARAREFAGLKGMDLARVVTTSSSYPWTEGVYDLDASKFCAGGGDLHVVAYDFGVKRNILRMLAQRGCRLTVVPATTPADTVIDLQPDGIFLSNGPGDPEPCDYAVTAITELLQRKVPMFGICLGHQLLALAAGARSFKMKFGHHGANHPVLDLATGVVAISSQNHGFAVDESSLPERVEVTHRSLFDDSIQGIALKDAPAFGFQGHPEASPGPHDVAPLFDLFIDSMRAAKDRTRAATN